MCYPSPVRVRQVHCEMLFTPGCSGNSSYDPFLQGIAAKELEKHFTGQASPRGAGCRRGTVGEMGAQPGSLQAAVYPSSKGAKGSQLAEPDPGILPSLPHPREKQMLVLHAGAPLAQTSHEWVCGVDGVSCSALKN